MSGKYKVVVSVLALLLIVSMVAVAAAPKALAEEGTKYEKYGPRVDYVLIKIYTDPEAEALALKAGEIDLMDWPLPAAKVEEFKKIEGIGLFEYVDLGMFELDFNCKKYPTNITEFRQAIAYLVDHKRIITEIVKGYGVPIYVPIPPMLKDFIKPDLKWPYEYNPEKAKELLAKIGFKDTDGDGILNDPKTGKDMDPIIIYGRADDPRRAEVARMIAEELKKIGVPVDLRIVDRSVCFQHVMGLREFHIYTGGWGLSRDIDYLYDLWHSISYSPPGSFCWNYIGFTNPESDKLLEKIKYGSTKEEIQKAAFEWEELFIKEVPMIPLWSDVGVIACNVKDWEGYVNAAGTGVRSWWTLLNVHPKGKKFGGVFRFGFKSDIESLNPFKAMWYWDWIVLSEIYDTLIAVDPFTLGDIPWLAESWTVEKTEVGGVPGLKITFKLVKNATWHDGKPFTAEDVKFTIELYRDKKSPVWFTYVKDVVKVETPDKYTVVVYLNTTSYWALHWIGGLPILPKHIWEKHLDDPAGWEPDMEPHPEVKGLTCLIGTGPFIFVKRKSGEYILLKANLNYFRRHPERTLRVSLVSAPKTVTVGKEAEVKVKVTFVETPITNATVVLSVAGKTFTLSHVGDGVYAGKIVIDTPGKYTAKVEASCKLGLAELKAATEFEIEAKKALGIYIAAAIVVIVVIAAAFLLRKRKAKAAA